MKKRKILAAAVLTAAIGAPIAAFIGDLKGQPMTSTGVRVPFLHSFPIGPIVGQNELALLERANERLNWPPLAASELRGKVVLVNFGTYTCINWRRQLPYVRAWTEKYKDQRLVVIGVDAPEFEFGKNIANVRWALKDLGIDCPVAVDNNHVIWRTFRNQAWPALYFIDAQGRHRHHFFGEGSYEQSEMMIQALLREAGATGVSREPANLVMGPASPVASTSTSKALAR
jgi:thiol-disulfide isomerase/thioredoxin